MIMQHPIAQGKIITTRTHILATNWNLLSQSDCIWLWTADLSDLPWYKCVYYRYYPGPCSRKKVFQAGDVHLSVLEKKLWPEKWQWNGGGSACWIRGWASGSVQQQLSSSDSKIFLKDSLYIFCADEPKTEIWSKQSFAAKWASRLVKEKVRPATPNEGSRIVYRRYCGGTSFKLLRPGANSPESLKIMSVVSVL